MQAINCLRSSGPYHSGRLSAQSPNRLTFKGTDSSTEDPLKITFPDYCTRRVFERIGIFAFQDVKDRWPSSKLLRRLHKIPANEMMVSELRSVMPSGILTDDSFAAFSIFWGCLEDLERTGYIQRHQYPLMTLGTVSLTEKGRALAEKAIWNDSSS